MNGIGCFIALVPFLVMLLGFFYVRETFPILAGFCLFLAACIVAAVGRQFTQSPSADLDVTAEINAKKLTFESALRRCADKEDWKAMGNIQALYSEFMTTIERNPKYEPNEGYWRYKKH